MSEETMLVDASAFADVEGLFEDKQGGRGTYLSIFDHAICERSKSFSYGDDSDKAKAECEANLAALQANDPAWSGPHKTVNPKTGADVWSNSKRYDRMIGRVADITKHTKEFNATQGGGKVTNWNILILTGGKYLTLQLVWVDHVLKRFLKVSPNVDFARPIFISAFGSMKDGSAKQAVSFKQYTGDLADIAAFRNVDKWDKIPEYWQADKKDASGKTLEGAKWKGLDGSELPPGVKDDEDDSWDYKAQNKFLASYFRDNILPKIKALAEQYGLHNADTDTSELTHSGIPQDDDTPVTEKPLNPVAVNVGDLISGKNTARIKQLALAMGREADFVTDKLVGATLGSLSDQAGKYVIYKLEDHMAKNPSAVVAPTPPPVVVAPEADDDLWDTGTPATALTGSQELAAAVAPRPDPTKPVPYDPNSNDDVLW